MKKNIFYYLAVMLLFTSCQGMDLFPEDKYSEGKFWKTAEDFEAAATAFYGSLLSFHGPDNFAEYDMKGDLATSYFGFNSVSNGRWLPTESDHVWTKSYDNLRQVNTLIKYADALKTTDEGILRYKGEALFFRAYEHFELVKRFGDVPLILKVLDVDSPELFEGRTPRVEVENAILKDLDEAIALLPTKSEMAQSETGRITWGAAVAFKARVALFVGTWAANHKHRNDVVELLTIAKNESKKLIFAESPEYSLYSGGTTWETSYRSLFLENGDNSSESILDRQYATNIDQGTVHPISDIASAGYLGGATKKFADMFLDNTGLPIVHSKSNFKGYSTVESEFENRDPRMTAILQVPGRKYVYAHTNGVAVTCPVTFTGISSTKTGYRVNKYISDMPGINPGLAYYNVRLIRFAEVLLIYVEATYELDGQISNADLDATINLIRARVGMPALTNEFVSANGLDMRNEIRRERTIELCFEANRYDDLRRWKTAEMEMTMPLTGVKFSSYAEANEEITPKLDGNGFVIAEDDRMFKPGRDYLAPIPTSEITMSNGAIKQNPSW